MRKIKSTFIDFFSFVGSFFYLFYWLFVNCFKSDFKNHIKKDKQGETIDIIVNGPSFTKQKDLVKDNGFDKCMVNFAANSPLFWELRPAYYCVSDPRFFRNAERNEEFETFFNNIKNVDWDMTFFATYYDYKHHIVNSDLLKLPHINFVPFHHTSFPLSFKFKKIAFWLFQKGQAMPIPMSVSIPVIMNAINSGYSFINLYGYDQDWIHNVVVDENNQVCLHDTHFYHEKGVLRPWKKNENETFKMFEMLQTQTELFESYWFIKEYVDFLGNVKITNMSPNSLIDAFNRKKM
jgi:hypothetical protein